MTSAFKDHRSDKHGQWVPIHYDGMLTAQYFSEKIPRRINVFRFFGWARLSPLG